MQINPAIEPSTSATVSASAGTGKTWSLVSRIIRLLLNNTDPGSILAITFTRKAAAEMQARLNERLLEFAACSTEDLKKNLAIIGAPVTSDSIEQARRLYEKILYATYPPRITTFHAMCQELLKRFPFDANVPPGFELTEQTTDLEAEARDMLFTEATLNNNGTVANALETLFYYCGGLDNTKLALDNFLKHRSDWWAFTLNEKDPVTYASDKLKTQLGITEISDPALAFFTPDIINKLKDFAELLSKNATATNQGFIQSIQLTLQQVEKQLFVVAFKDLVTVFFTSEGNPRKRNPSAKQKKLMGEAGEQSFLELHEYFVDQINLTSDKQAKLNTLQVSNAWYTAGQRLLRHFQTIKEEQRLLDFADLEWNAFLLLSDENQAAWVQYKLDSRINHVLIDEYQDTNPTQWHLLKPLLEEISSSTDAENRSIFIVGDSKQSIYRFRRAQPKLFEIAQNWLQENIKCVNSSLDLSRRSSPAIINFVNAVFAEGALKEHITNFEPHSTHLDTMWGKVVIPPLFIDNNSNEQEENASEENQPYRNPLLVPLVIEEDQRRINEAEFIANEIETLMNNKTIIGSSGSERYLNYSDIIILLGARTHAAVYQKALNAMGIPYVGINKGTLLETLEIRDLSALLNILVMPFDNLALAQVLKSPIFNCSDNELLHLATIQNGDWFDRLFLLAQKKPDNTNINRAINLLSNWKNAAGKLPVHDLLDKIISESNLINRYIATYPDHLKHSVESNLNRFVELALEIDSGRYPSISRFLQRLNSLRDNQKDAPDELPAGKNADRVRLLTIHAAKGLEAPVIFLADANSLPQSKDAYQALVNWPPEATRPEHFLLALRKEDQDQMVKQLFASQGEDIQREQANLLYVALTRARQLLYITANQAKKDGGGIKWYDTIRAQLEKYSDLVEIKDDGTLLLGSHEMPATISAVSPVVAQKKKLTIPELTKPIPPVTTEIQITPSLLIQHQPPLRATEIQTSDENTDTQLRGVIIHKIMQLLTEMEREQAWERTQQIYQNLVENPLLTQYWDEATSLVDNEKFKYLFDQSCIDSAYNEVPVQYTYRNYKLHGIIDRLVVSGETVYLVDYKTTKVSGNTPPSELLHRYESQMSIYYHGISKLWPDYKLAAQVLFTQSQTSMEITPGNLEQII